MTTAEHAARVAAAEEDGQALSDWMRVVSEQALAERAQDVDAPDTSAELEIDA